MTIPKIIRLLSLTLLVTTLSCSGTQGIQRSAELQSLPDLSCIRNVIEKTPGITSVDESHGGKNHHYFISDKKHLFNISIFENDNGSISFSLYSLKGHGSYSNEEILKKRRIMIEIEKRIESICNIKGIHSSMIEQCYNKDCPIDE